MSTNFTTPAVVKAVPTRDPATGLPISPIEVAAALQAHLNELLAQGYEVLGVLAIPDGVLCTAVHPRWGVCEPEQVIGSYPPPTYQYRGVSLERK